MAKRHIVASISNKSGSRLGEHNAKLLDSAHPCHNRETAEIVRAALKTAFPDFFHWRVDNADPGVIIEAADIGGGTQFSGQLRAFANILENTIKRENTLIGRSPISYSFVKAREREKYQSDLNRLVINPTPLVDMILDQADDPASQAAIASGIMSRVANDESVIEALAAVKGKITHNAAAPRTAGHQPAGGGTSR